MEKIIFLKWDEHLKIWLVLVKGGYEAFRLPNCLFLNFLADFKLDKKITYKVDLNNIIIEGVNG